MYTKDEIKDRLSISTLVFYKYFPICERSLESLAKNGIGKIELLEAPDQFDMTAGRSMGMIGDMCRLVGIRVSSYHCFWTNFSEINSDREFTERLDKCKRQIDTLMELGGKVWGSHAREADDYMKKGYEELARYVEGQPVVITVENFGRERMSIKDRLEFLSQMDHPQVGLILDVGHQYNADRENVMTIPGKPTEILQSCSKYLKHIHLHGYIDKDHYPPFANGDLILWGELLRGLEKIGYPGDFNFEPSGEPRNAFPQVVESVGMAPKRLVELMAAG